MSASFTKMATTLAAVRCLNAGQSIATAIFDMAGITHKVGTSRGLLQTVWKKLKAEIGDLSNLNKVRKQGTW